MQNLKKKKNHWRIFARFPYVFILGYKKNYNENKKKKCLLF